MRQCGGCTVEHIRTLLEYDPDSGLFRWKIPSDRRPRGWFKGNKSVRKYRRLYIEGRHYLAHVVAWALMTGQWPDHEIDHKDRDQANNTWTNLRPATHVQNGQNKSVGSNSKTGIRGVTVFGDRFRANIRVEGKFISLGLFSTVADAAAARLAAEKVYYGEFGNGG